MKISVKLSAVTAAAVFLVSLLFSVWTLVQEQQGSIEEAFDNGLEELERGWPAFEEELESQKDARDNTRIYRGRISFRERFPDRALLWYKGRCVAGAGEYEFDLDQMPENGSPAWLNRPEKRGAADRVFLEKAGGSRLLVFYKSSGDFEMICFRDITGIYQRTEEIFFRGTVLSILLSGGVAALVFLLTREILRPLYQLQRTAGVIAKGNFEQRIKSGRKDEIGALAKSFDCMAEEIEKKIRGLQEMYERQQRLVAGLAHEMKTPMTAIQGFAETLQRVALTSEKRYRALDYIDKECRRLSALSAKMLELAQYEEPAEALEKRPIKLSELFEQIRRIMSGHREANGICLDIQAPLELEVEADESLLASCILNLLDNACKASAQGQTVRLRGSEEGILVEDEGCGIPKEEIGKVMEPFYMVDKSRARKQGGAGLGLALCRQIAALHGWELEIESAVGRGTRVWLRTGGCARPDGEV